ncbi:MULTISPECIES: HD-GYP domain-containing protein [unclassified Salinivibrio]|uniref:HD-GYP domain-containing protein n=1 Tax=unclassified Salinivibrio TaxID=2636825 RepID=UPI000988FD70|nr:MULTISPECIES: HD-GYP domain-containing protein [unclassified Salinivibrio]NUY55459.1 HD-GYP domain-containing protein [Salinivibrio sp. EAGSL]OOF05957.1 metal-dependent phosphohydrolase [Salinivibrio sp. MA607]
MQPHINDVTSLKLSELILALSTALDMTEGQPPEHCMRCTWLGMKLADALALDDQQRHDLFYTLLLKDAGCSSNAARICELYLTNDLAFKQSYKVVDGSLSSVLNFVLKNTGVKRGFMQKLSTTLDIIRHGDMYAQELIETRCTRGADVARDLRFSESVAEAIYALDEHYDGGGRPDQLKADQIPLFSRIALMTQVIDVFRTESGVDAALRELKNRRGTWFDPDLVDTFLQLAHEPQFWQQLDSPTLKEEVLSMTPANTCIWVDDDYMDDIAAAFGRIVDAKSPFTSGHSERVSVYASLIADELNISEHDKKWLKRGALLHDIGKLGVSNNVLDKPGKLDDEEWEHVKRHAALSKTILSKIHQFDHLAKFASAHHEKLDGSGYPDGMQGDDISLLTRIITTADIFDAITAERPYRGPIPMNKALSIMKEETGTAIDARCLQALIAGLERLPEHFIVHDDTSITS